MGLLALLLSGLGLGYLDHKSKQEIKNMQAQYHQTYGKGEACLEEFGGRISESKIQKQYVEKITEYFNERVGYYVSHPEEINDDDYKRRIKDISDELKIEFETRFFAGCQAYDDIVNKFSPSYKECREHEFLPPINIYKVSTITNIANKLARVDVYNEGYTPSHMRTRNGRLYDESIYTTPIPGTGSIPGFSETCRSDPKWVGGYDGYCNANFNEFKQAKEKGLIK